MRAEALDVVLVRTAQADAARAAERPRADRRCFPAPSNRAPTRPAPGSRRSCGRRPTTRRPLLDRLWSGCRTGSPTCRSPSAHLSGAPTVVTVVVTLLVAGLLLWVLPRVRRERSVRRPAGAVLEDPRVTAAQYRERAAEARGAGRYGDAVLDSFRAIARDMSDRTLLDDAPGLTAHEVSVAVATAFPARRRRAGPRRGPVRLGALRQRRRGPQDADDVAALDAALARTPGATPPHPSVRDERRTTLTRAHRRARSPGPPSPPAGDRATAGSRRRLPAGSSAAAVGAAGPGVATVLAVRRRRAAAAHRRARPREPPARRRPRRRPGARAARGHRRRRAVAGRAAAAGPRRRHAGRARLRQLSGRNGRAALRAARGRHRRRAPLARTRTCWPTWPCRWRPVPEAPGRSRRTAPAAAGRRSTPG